MEVCNKLDLCVLENVFLPYCVRGFCPILSAINVKNSFYHNRLNKDPESYQISLLKCILVVLPAIAVARQVLFFCVDGCSGLTFTSSFVV